MSKIYVDEIRHSGGAIAAMQLDSTGRILTPARPAFNVWYSGSNIAATNTIVWNQVEVNVGSCYSSSTGEFTAPCDGLYQFNTFAVSTAGTDAEFGIRAVINGTASSNKWSYTMKSASTYSDTTLSFVLDMNANDTLKIQVQNGNMLGAVNYHNNFSGYLLG